MLRKPFKVVKAVSRRIPTWCSTLHVRTDPVLIGGWAFLSANAFICKGVSLGKEAVVAAGSVVVAAVSAGATWGGHPARG